MMPVSRQQAHPGQGPQEEAHTHGQHDQQVQKPLHPRPLPGDEIGDRIADDQTDERRNQGVPHRAQEDPGKGAGEDLGQIVQRKQTGGRISQSVEHHNAQGNQDKDGHPDDIGDGEEEGPPGPPARGGFRVILLHLRHPPSVRRILRNRNAVVAELAGVLALGHDMDVLRVETDADDGPHRMVIRGLNEPLEALKSTMMS